VRINDVVQKKVDRKKSLTDTLHIPFLPLPIPEFEEKFNRYSAHSLPSPIPEFEELVSDCGIRLKS